MLGQAPSWVLGPATSSQRVHAGWDAAGWTVGHASGTMSPRQRFIPESRTRLLVAVSNSSPAPRVPHRQRRQTRPAPVTHGPWEGGATGSWALCYAAALSRSVCSRKISTFGCRDFQGSENAVPIIKHLLCICLSCCRDSAPALALPSLSSSEHSGPGWHPLPTALSRPGGTTS